MSNYPNTIQAIGITSPTGQLQKINLPLKELGPHDILVKIEAVSINPVDYKKLEMLKSDPVTEQNPGILGFDASGTVVSVGSQVQLFQIGDEVYYAGDLTKLGSNSNYQIVDERIVGKKPSNLTHIQAAAVPLVALTAYEGLVEEMRISDKEEDKDQNKNKKVLIVGGAGGVGSIAIQIAKKILGLTVIATASRQETIEYSKKMGADYVINHSNSLIEELKKIGIDSLDYIFNTSYMSQKYFDDFAKLIKPFGHIVGIVNFHEPLNLQQIFVKRVKLSMEFMFTRSMFQVEPQKQYNILQKISKLYEEDVLISTAQTFFKFNLENLLAAHQQIKSGTTIGKIVLTDVQQYFS